MFWLPASDLFINCSCYCHHCDHCSPVPSTSSTHRLRNIRFINGIIITIVVGDVVIIINALWSTYWRWNLLPLPTTAAALLTSWHPCQAENSILTICSAKDQVHMISGHWPPVQCTLLKGRFYSQILMNLRKNSKHPLTPRPRFGKPVALFKPILEMPRFWEI